MFWSKFGGFGKKETMTSREKARGRLLVMVGRDNDGSENAKQTEALVREITEAVVTIVNKHYKTNIDKKLIKVETRDDSVDLSVDLPDGKDLKIQN